MISDTQVTELKSLLPSASNILIALPQNAELDKLASALALFLAFEGQGRQASIVCEDTLRVGQAHLFGIDHVQKTLPQTSGGNLTLVLENVASNGVVPSLEKLDWNVDGNNLNLVFKVLVGQSFQPARIVPKYQGSGFDLIFVVGGANLNSLGNIYTQNQNIFLGGVQIVNIDNSPQNTGFGKTNLNDLSSASISEILVSLIPIMGLPLDQDIATNLLAGIYEGTNNLANEKVNADTFQSVATLLKTGGKKPQSLGAAPGQGLDLSGIIPPAPQPSSQIIPPSRPEAAPQEPYTLPPVMTESQPSPEERPSGEGLFSAESIEPEPDWLTPKVFSGKSLG